MKKPTHYYINNSKNLLSESLTNSILKNNDAFSFHKSIKSYTPTPLVKLPGLANKLGVRNIYIKDESHRFGLKAFKGLGASYAVYKTIQNHPKIKTFCTATDGNHGRALAWSARFFDKKAVIYMPKDTVKSRRDAISKEGAIVEKLDLNYDETCNYARSISKKKGWQLIQDTSWEGYEEIPALIMSGYLTCLKELGSSLHSELKPTVDVVFLQVGVGSWAAAAVWYYLNRYGIDRPKIVLVEPFESDGMMESLKCGFRTIPKGNQKSIMAGLNCGIPSLNAWEIIKLNIDAIIKIEDSYAKKAMKTLFNPSGSDSKIIAGESGAAGFAGFLKIISDESSLELKTALNITKNSSVLFYNTEGDTDPVNFRRINSEFKK